MKILARIPKKHAQRVLRFLQEQNAIDTTYKVKKTQDIVSVVVSETPEHQFITYEQAEPTGFDRTSPQLTLRDALIHKKIPFAEQIKTAFDMVGTIAIMEIDPQYREFEQQIGQTVLELHSSIQTVLRKDGPHQGAFRAQPMVFLAGVDTRQTTHHENGVKITIDVEQVYYSPRLSNERLRIADLVKDGESILHLFSGCAPYECVIGKRKNVLQVGVELNPVGHAYGVKNIRQNKITNCVLFNEDAGLFTPSQQFTRIIMNLPKTAYQFLDRTIPFLAVNGVLHYYDFLHEDEFDIAVQRVKDACEKHGRVCEVLGIHTCGMQGVRIYRICVDVRIK